MKGKLYKYKGEHYLLNDLAKFLPEGVTKGALSQRICTRAFDSIEDCVDTPRVNNNIRPKRRVQREPVNRIGLHKPQVLFWAKTSTSHLPMRIIK